MFRFVSLFALAAVALAEPEADPQFLYNHVSGVAGVPLVHTYGAHAVRHVVPLVNTYATHVVKPVVPVVKYHVPVVNHAVPVVKYNVPVFKHTVPVVKYVDPHHSEGMTGEGVPEKTDSVKIAEKQHEIAQIYENSKLQYVAPHAAYAGYPVYNSYVHHPYAAHAIGKREADSDSTAEADSDSTAEAEADPYYLYNTYGGAAHTGVYNNAYHAGVYNNAYHAGVYNAGVYSPYAAARVHSPYTHGVVGYNYPAGVHHSIGKREADSDADAHYFYNGYGYPSAYNYGYPSAYNYGYNAYPHGYGARSVYGYHY